MDTDSQKAPKNQHEVIQDLINKNWHVTAGPDQSYLVFKDLEDEKKILAYLENVPEALKTGKLIVRVSAQNYQEAIDIIPKHIPRLYLEVRL